LTARSKILEEMILISSWFLLLNNAQKIEHFSRLPVVSSIEMSEKIGHANSFKDTIIWYFYEFY